MTAKKKQAPIEVPTVAPDLIGPMTMREPIKAEEFNAIMCGIRDTWDDKLTGELGAYLASVGISQTANLGQSEGEVLITITPHVVMNPAFTHQVSARSRAFVYGAIASVFEELKELATAEIAMEEQGAAGEPEA
jgi:hypothetical protein